AFGAFAQPPRVQLGHGLGGVADPRPIALGELPLQRCYDRSAIGSLLYPLLMCPAADAALPRQHHRLGFVVGLLAPLHRECNERRRIFEPHFAPQRSVRSRSRRASNSAMVSALIMPRKRRRCRSITGIRVVTS